MEVTSKPETKNVRLPKDGLAGLKENFSADAVSGFIVFLLAMPLSLGIAKASDFPPIYGILTAIVGGLVVSFFAGSRLTVKGPAAGLIVICAEAVAEFGKGDAALGWHLALGAIVVAGAIQVLFGFLKFGKYSDFVPSSAIHGMLAAIGIIILSKQIHALLGIDPNTLKGLQPLGLLARIPASLQTMDWKHALIGVVSLAIVLGMPMIRNKWIEKIPATLVVLLIAIPLELKFDFRRTDPAFDLGSMGNLTDAVRMNVDFGGMADYLTFIKFVALFALIGSIESLLTVKAIDNMDPYHRKSNTNKDLIAVGIGNMVSGFLGGLPMISEVARSSSNVNNGAKTRWANFFHGFWLLVFVLTAQPIIELIPNAALAALLVAVGYKLAHPKEFCHALHVGKEQFVVFVATIIITLSTDLLVGVFSGIAIELAWNYFTGKTSLKNLFKPNVAIERMEEQKHHYVKISESLTFSNYMGFMKQIEDIPDHDNVTIDLSDIALVDHTALQNLASLARNHENAGGKLEIVGLNGKQVLGKSEASARKG